MNGPVDGIEVGYRIKIVDGPNEYGEKRGSGRQKVLVEFERVMSRGAFKKPLWAPVRYVPSATARKYEGEGYDLERGSHDDTGRYVVVFETIFSRTGRNKPLILPGSRHDFAENRRQTYVSIPASLAQGGPPPPAVYEFSGKRYKEAKVFAALDVLAKQGFDRVGVFNTTRACPVTLESVIQRLSGGSI